MQKLYSRYLVNIGCWRCGAITVFLHDLSDIVIDLLRITHYMGLDSDSGYFLAELFFVMNLVTWV